MRPSVPRWLPGVLKRIHDLAGAGRVRLTLKALRELLELDLGLDEADACDVLLSLVARDSQGRLISAHTGEWMYIFTPHIAKMHVYLKLILRADCVMISFHEQVDDDDDEAAP